MAIYWSDHNGKTGIAEDPYEFAMQHSVNLSAKGNREELSPQQRIDNAFGEGPTPELKDQNAPYSWGMGEDLKDLGTSPDASDADWNKAYGTKRAGEFIPIQATRDDLVDQNQTKLANMIHDLRVKFMGDPEKWSTKEEVGNFINQAMSVMGAGVRMPKLPGMDIRISPTNRPPGKLNAEGIQKIKDLVAEGKNVKEIAQELDVVPNSIYVKIREQGIRAPGLESIKIPNEGTFTERLSNKISTTLPSKNNLAAADYPHMQKQFLTTLDKGITTREGIAGELQISPYQVTQLAQRFGLDFKLPIGKVKPTVSEEVSIPNRNWTPEKDKILLKHIYAGLSYTEAGALMGMTRGQIAGRLNRLK